MRNDKPSLGVVAWESFLDDSVIYLRLPRQKTARNDGIYKGKGLAMTGPYRDCNDGIYGARDGVRGVGSFAQRAIAPCIVLHFARRTQRFGGYTHVGDVVKRHHPEITAAQVVIDHTHLNILGA